MFQNVFCAVLAVDDTYDDRYIQGLLKSSGLKGFISESTLAVPMDDFGTLKMVPLDSYQNEIEKFDPRENGYAAKLKHFFVRDGYRYFFLPPEENIRKFPVLEYNPVSSTAKVDKLLRPALRGIPFSLTMLKSRQAIALNFIVIASSCAMVFFTSNSRQHFIYVIPVLLALGSGGSLGTVLAALMAGIWELLRLPVKELFASHNYNRKSIDYAGAGFRGIRKRLKPFRVNLFLSLLFLFIFSLVSFLGKLFPIPLFVSLLVFSLLYYMTFRREAIQTGKYRHIVFTPVLIFPHKTKTFFLFPFLAPFAAMSILALLIFGFMPFTGNARHPIGDYILSAEDYYHHISFQKSFSFRPLNREISGGDVYHSYYLGGDGLIADSMEYEAGPETSLLFPLEKLMEFLVNYNKGAGIDHALKEWISVAIILAACSVDLIRPGRKKTVIVPVLGDKRMAA